ncbi:hypothetical protein AJ79_06754 [Helicocarpus griseus UAMH5409]|uniref:pyridoxal 5'-phosphate synthase n=1 Tax=Helicocarpus griseus UAMH5409 TaxID=1447875 RepID=A0A2B7XA57_9EURO|nr:hypothetical protein AJ79_06754 [Helicocarpus griseus UAMH5409]
MTLDKQGGSSDSAGIGAAHAHRQPKKLIFAPGDIAAPYHSPNPQSASSSANANANITSPPNPAISMPAPTPIPSQLLPAHTNTTPPSSNLPVSLPPSTAPTPLANAALVSHPARAHQFLTNPPLTISQLNLKNPFHQFNAWFRDPRLPPSSAPETCTLATASLPSGRVSARTLYLKELDERGWVVYSNWGGRWGKGGQVFGNGEGGIGGSEAAGQQEGNRWAALTFHWPAVERQVRVEGLVEELSREESETYWRTRERGSQIGGWASQQSKVLWEVGPEGATTAGSSGAGAGAGADAARTTIDGEMNELVNGDDMEDLDDGRSILEDRVKQIETRFADTEEIPLPPFWGGVRIVPESVEFWQGRKSRLHDRFRYVRVHGEGETGEETAKAFRWRVQRLSP